MRAESAERRNKEQEDELREAKEKLDLMTTLMKSLKRVGNFQFTQSCISSSFKQIYISNDLFGTFFRLLLANARNCMPPMQISPMPEIYLSTCMGFVARQCRFYLSLL